jgi:hypothetical protein
MNCSLEKVRNGPANNIGEIKISPDAIGRSVHAFTLANQVTWLGHSITSGGGLKYTFNTSSHRSLIWDFIYEILVLQREEGSSRKESSIITLYLIQYFAIHISSAARLFCLFGISIINHFALNLHNDKEKLRFYGQSICVPLGYQGIFIEASYGSPYARQRSWAKNTSQV